MTCGVPLGLLVALSIAVMVTVFLAENEASPEGLSHRDACQ
jgi:hypothetical protein